MSPKLIFLNPENDVQQIYTDHNVLLVCDIYTNRKVCHTTQICIGVIWEGVGGVWTPHFLVWGQNPDFTSLSSQKFCLQNK